MSMSDISGFDTSDLSGDSISSAVNANPQAQAMYPSAAPTGGPVAADSPQPSTPPPSVAQQGGAAANLQAMQGVGQAGAGATSGAQKTAGRADVTNWQGKNKAQAMAGQMKAAVPMPAMPHPDALPPAPSPAAAHAAGYQTTIQASPIYQRMIASMGGT